MFRQFKPYFSIVCPCDLLMIIAKAGVVGNCLLMRSKGSLTSEGIKDHLGVKTRCPMS